MLTGIMSYITKKDIIHLTDNQKTKMQNLVDDMPIMRDEYSDAAKDEKNDLWEKKRAQIHSKEDVDTYFTSDYYKKLSNC